MKRRLDPDSRIPWYYPVLLCLFIIYTILSCGCVEEKSPEINKTITIGILLPLTGELAGRGNECLNGSILAIEEINKNGGIRSKEGQLLRYIIADSKGNATIGAMKTKEFILNHTVTALVGAYQSNVAIAATQIAEQYKTPFMVNTGISDVIIERGYSYTFRIIPTVDDYAHTKVEFLEYMNRRLINPIKTVALIYENTAFGTSAALAEHKFLKRGGFTIPIDTSYVAADVDNYLEEIRRTVREKPDAIFTTTYLKDGIIISRELKNAGFTGPVIYSGGGTISQAFIDALGPDAEGIYSVSEFVYSLPAVRDLNKRYYARFGVNLSGASAHTYQTILVLSDALERAASLENEDIRTALSETNITSDMDILIPDDYISFSPEGQNEYSRLTMMQVQNGSWTTVWPDTYAESTPDTNPEKP
jgi:branched-chain amino acid transport system substrate-binding protein